MGKNKSLLPERSLILCYVFRKQLFGEIREPLQRSINLSLDRAFRNEMHIRTWVRLSDAMDSVSTLLESVASNRRLIIENRTRGEQVDSRRTGFILTDDDSDRVIVLELPPDRFILRSPVENHVFDLAFP